MSAGRLHQPNRARCIQILNMPHHRLADRAHLPRRRPQEPHANVIDHLAKADGGGAAHHLDVVAAFLVSELELQPADGSYFHPLATFDQTARSTDVNDSHAVLTHEHRGGTTLVCHPRLTGCSNKMLAL